MKLTKQKLKQIIKEEKKLLTEKKELDQKIIDKVAKMTDWNDHNGARIELAKWVKNKKLLKAYEGVKAIHDFHGSLPPCLYELRYKLLDKRLESEIEHMFTNAEDIWNAM